MLKITMNDETSREVQFGTCVGTLFEGVKYDYEILAAKINNKIYSLDKELRYNSSVAPVFSNTTDGLNVYRRSLCLLLAASAQKLFPKKRLLVGHSLGSGYYYTLHSEEELSQSIIDALENEMRSIVEKNIPITSEFISYQEALDYFKKENLPATLHQMDFMCPPRVKIVKLQEFRNVYFGPVVPSTGFLKTFELKKYAEGFLLRFPKPTDPNTIPPFEDQPKLFQIYSSYKKWGTRLGVSSVAQLNQMIVERKINDFIDITETLQEKCIADIADQIASRKKVRVVLIAGPSSSGKTTTSKRLALELLAIGYHPKLISLDNYYVGHDRTPRDENGNFDFECIEALDVPLLNQNLMDLFDGKEVALPLYNFHTGEQIQGGGEKIKLESNDILIIEGIHGLNDRLTPKIPAELKFKIYLSALTQLNLDDQNRISTSDNRLIRRIVRDHNFRGKSAAGTIAMWPAVRKGEELHIFPFQNNADAILNTALDYELSVLKVYAEPLLRCVKPTQEEYSEACSLLHFLDNFATIAPDAVPPRSIIREFIGGSAFKY